MVETVNNLLQPRAQLAWRGLPTGEQLHSATLLLDTVETGAFMLADNLLKTDIVQETTDNIREYPLCFHPSPSLARRHESHRRRSAPSLNLSWTLLSPKSCRGALKQGT